MKKKTPNDITGRVVMVHPSLTTDPIQRQGEIAKVIEISPLNKEVLTVEFVDGKKAAYFSDGLLTLYPKEIILQGLQSNSINQENRKLILSVFSLTGERKYGEALKLAITNDTTKFFCATTCSDWLDMKKEQKNNQGKGHRR
jgi:hypothetical protein